MSMSKNILFNSRSEYCWLSNWFPSPFIHKGKLFKTVEHYYQYYKTKDQVIRTKVMDTYDPARAKYLTSEKNKAQVREDWPRIKERVMLIGLRYKFDIPVLRDLLLNTGRMGLIEETYWHDTYWGICTCKKCNGAGDNNLGLLLMKVRSELKEQL